MKIASLPTGNVLKFPDEIPDDIIDKAVEAHLAQHTAKTKAEKEKQDKEKAEGTQRHDQIIQSLAIIAQLLHNLTQHSINEHGTISKNHQEATHAFNDLLKTIKTPKKRRLIRDSKGKTIGAEEYE